MPESAQFKVFRGGVPTEPDIEKLLSVFGVPQVGTTLAYEDIEAVLRLARHSSRWSSVITAWRKRLYDENNILFVALRGVGFQVADNHRRVEAGAKKHEQGIRHVKRSQDILVKTGEEDLDPHEKKQKEHVLRVGAAVLGAHQLGKKELKWQKKLVEKNGES